MVNNNNNYILGSGVGATSIFARRAKRIRSSTCKSKCTSMVINVTPPTITDLYNTLNYCASPQYYQLLINRIPAELQNLKYTIYPDNLYYNNCRLVYNKLLNYYPLAIMYPNTEQYISYLISTIVKYQMLFAIRCSGHSYEPASLSNGFIIDLKFLNKYIIVSDDRKTARVSTGMNLGYLATQLSKQSLCTPTGEFSSVGFSGLFLNGGKGKLTRYLGLSCDNIVSARMVNYEGAIINASSTENPELLWAIKGAGSCNFGVITELEINVYDDIFIHFETLTWDWDKDTFIGIFNKYQNWVTEHHSTNTITGNFNMMYNNGVAKFSISFQKIGSGSLDAEILQFLNDNNPTITTNCIGYYSKLTGCWLNQEDGNYPPFSKIKSTMVFENMSDANIELLAESIETQLTLNLLINYQLNFSQMGGEVESIDEARQGCYFPRDAKWVLSIFSQWTNPIDTEDIINFLSTVYNDIIDKSPYCFPNLIDYSIPNYMNSYYGDNKDQLINIKTLYDPNNVFKSRQSIPVNPN